MTNPDTSTLNGSLEQLGITMAANLVTMGVTDADASDGLTTLAGKILLVPQGGGTIAVSLASDKSVLSYYNTESATLSATVTENGSAKSGATVEFFKGSTSLGTATTDSNGVATKSYASTGAGDVSFSATCSSVTSSPVTVEDCFYWNETGVTLTTTSSTDTTYPSGIDYGHIPNGKYMVEFDMQMVTSFRLYFNGTKVTTHEQTNYGTGFSRDSSGRLVISTRTTTTSNQNTSSGISSGSWQTLKMVIDGTSRKIYHNGTQIVSDTLSWLPDYTYYFNWAAWATGSTGLKNIKIKAV